MKVLVCLSHDEPRPRETLCAGAELAEKLQAPLSAVLIEPRGSGVEKTAPGRWALTREFTSNAWRLRADDPSPALRNFVRLRRITHLVLGGAAERNWAQDLRKTLK